MTSRVCDCTWVLALRSAHITYPRTGESAHSPQIRVARLWVVGLGYADTWQYGYTCNILRDIKYLYYYAEPCTMQYAISVQTNYLKGIGGLLYSVLKYHCDAELPIHVHTCSGTWSCTTSWRVFVTKSHYDCKTQNVNKHVIWWGSFTEESGDGGAVKPTRGIQLNWNCCLWSIA